MRKSNTQLLQSAKDYVTDPSTTSSTNITNTADFLKRENNNAIRTIYNVLKKAKQVQRTQATVTVADQQFYKKPVDYGNFVSATVTVGSTLYPLVLVTSIDKWNWLNYQSYSSEPPRFIYVRRDDYGIWPEPSTANRTITLTYNYLSKDLHADDYTTGTITTTQNDETVSGSGTSWASAMEGRWLRATTTSGSLADSISDWYKIDSITSTTELELNTVYETPALASASYIIGESPEIPAELHHLIPHYSASMFFAGPRRDKAEAQAHLNFFWTGDFNNNSRRPSDAKAGLLGAVASYSETGEGVTGIVNRRRSFPNPYDERFRSGVISL